jgi:prepilin peptidase CpaA
MMARGSGRTELGRGMLVDVVKLVLFPAAMAFAASSDLLTMTISNRIALVLVGGFFSLALVVGMPPGAILEHAEAALLVLAVAFGLFSRGWIGGGDAKLAAATALWFGWVHLLDYLLYASLLGGALTLALLEFRKFSLPARLARSEWIERLHRPEGGVPYGIALATAALLIYPYTTWMEAVGR